MILSAIFHRPMSEYAHALDEETYIFRLRAGKGDLEEVTFGFADRASMEPTLEFFERPMKRVRSDKLYDWFEIELHTEYDRVAYYFKMSDGKEVYYYLGDCFEKSLEVGRADFFQLPYNLHANRLSIPKWVGDSVVYNIFPDSFASGKRAISGQASSCTYEGEQCNSLLGGTVKGITENLDYIREMGFNCIYLNPVFVATSYHKYDLLDYFHIDPTRGTDEDMHELVETAHKMGMRVIVDGVFNHTCYRHKFFKDVLEKGKASEYYDYFYNLGGDEVHFPGKGEELSYKCFAYVPEMPKTNTANAALREYFCSVGEYWVKEFDVDGWRLDVANEVDDEFLYAFRKRVKAAKPDALVIGEVWENASHYINNQGMDSAMNYDFRRFVAGFVTAKEPDAEGYDLKVSNLLFRYPKQALYSQLNLLDSHDVSRFLSVCEGDLDKMELAILLQMTFPGMPSVFYGDEAGLEGVSEPEYRQAMNFEKKHPLYDIYKKLIGLRCANSDIRYADYETLAANGGYYAFRRGKVSVYLNAGKEPVKVEHFDKSSILLQKGLYDDSLVSGGYVVVKE